MHLSGVFSYLNPKYLNIQCLDLVLGLIQRIVERNHLGEQPVNKIFIGKESEKRKEK